ncbi:Lysine-specific demethylase 4 [Colletotrichum trifolii]|uniref:Lysine-specific demethylase 4 n=1 Tax=Colletotrichum trifolii TaxID=5466 RepID=A0A4R8RHP9_COLTR|nr:Lysine-specific demethylase 4 [Colletotrichum trifolii]
MNVIKQICDPPPSVHYTRRQVEEGHTPASAISSANGTAIVDNRPSPMRTRSNVHCSMLPVEEPLIADKASATGDFRLAPDTSSDSSLSNQNSINDCDEVGDNKHNGANEKTGNIHDANKHGDLDEHYDGKANHDGGDDSTPRAPPSYVISPNLTESQHQDTSKKRLATDADFVCRLSDLRQKTMETIGRTAASQRVQDLGFARFTVEDSPIWEDIVDYALCNNDPEVLRYHITTSSKKDGTLLVAYKNDPTPGKKDVISLSATAIEVYGQAECEEVFDFDPTCDRRAGPYIIGEANSFRGCRPSDLDCGRLHDLLTESIPGITTSYLYYSAGKQTRTTMHVEDLLVPSVNLLRWGAPKVWLIVKPGSTKLLEEKISASCYNRTKRRPRCSQFVRHLDRNIPPGTLTNWGVEYTIVYCYPGQLIVTMPNTYHQVVNLGPNLAEAVNLVWDERSLRDIYGEYKFCERSNRCAEVSTVQRHHCRLGPGGDKGKGTQQPASSTAAKKRSRAAHDEESYRMKRTSHAQRPLSRPDPGRRRTS